MKNCTDPFRCFEKLRFLVYGDVIADHYFYGRCTKLCQEGPVPVFLVGDTTLSYGAANCVRDNLEEAILSPGAALLLPFVPKTSHKYRYYQEDVLLLRVDREDGVPFQFSASEQEEALLSLEEELHHVDAVIISDYHKGAVTYLSQKMIKDSGLPVYLDPHPKTKYIFNSVALMTPNRAEYEALRLSHFDMVESSPVIITEGAGGVTVLDLDREPVVIPAKERAPICVTGAGDCLMAYAACAVQAGFSVYTAARLGNIAAGIGVMRKGNSVCGREDLARSVEQEIQAGNGRGLECPAGVDCPFRVQQPGQSCSAALPTSPTGEPGAGE